MVRHSQLVVAIAVAVSGGDSLRMDPDSQQSDGTVLRSTSDDSHGQKVIRNAEVVTDRDYSNLISVEMDDLAVSDLLDQLSVVETWSG